MNALLNKLPVGHLDFLNPSVRDWIYQGFENNGPWKYKKSIKEKTNCFLQFALSGMGDDALDIREYLCNQDEYSIWVENMMIHVSPWLEKNVIDDWEITDG